jgi:hypothetical protein
LRTAPPRRRSVHTCDTRRTAAVKKLADRTPHLAVQATEVRAARRSSRSPAGRLLEERPHARS